MADSALCHLHFFLIPLLLLSTIAPIHQAVPSGSSLSTLDENAPWVSPNGDFAFGFRRLPNNDLFLLAIWFEKIPEKTLVWSANRDNPVQRESKVELTNDGQLVLYDHQGREIWRPTTTRATSASMLDTGNFVLQSMDSSNIWQSFNEPTDTILPTQTLNKTSRLSSPKRETDYSRGKFQLRLLEDGNLVLYLVALSSEFTYAPYWITGTAGSGLQVIFNETGYIYLTQTNGTIVSITSGDVVSTKEFYHRATLDFDGVFRQYVYPKTQGARWGRNWSYVMYKPPNVCLSVLTSVGSGTCGFNSYCMLDENQKPSCLCPTGYTYVDPNYPFAGCKQDFVPQSCELGGSVEETQYEMKEMRNVDWPLNDYERYHPINEDGCRQACLEDCYCAVAIFKEDTCWKKKMPLSNGKMDYNISRKTLIKTRINSSLLIPPPPSSCKEKKDRTTWILIVSVLFGGSGLLNILLLLAISLILLCSYRQWKPKSAPFSNANMLGIRIHSFTYKEIEQATNGFKEEFDSGPFGAVYKGVFVLDSRHLVAVKKLEKEVSIGDSDKEFETEVNAIGQTHHKNLVRLLGFCNEGLHRFLVYEFMSSGSLASFLFGSMRPDWNQRMQIALGVARGLAYLHEECCTQIIHCDINPQNILLDEFFTAKISDFGLAKLMKAEQTRSITSIRGTKGYVAPEWFKNMPITAKVDVYSFGVLLLEIICCRRNVEMGLENEERIILTDWAYDCYVESKLDLLVENDDEAINDMKRVERLVMVAIWCIQENPMMRPGMEKITEMLEGVAEVSKPLHPYSMSSVVSS